jgi:glycosyltransferase involved in cell wall biosynthesis
MDKPHRCKIAFMWPGLPDYAARSIGEFIRQTAHEITVIATKPQVPIMGMERSLGQPVIWMDGSDHNASWEKYDLVKPDIVFQGGWAQPAFKSLSRQARKCGTKVVLMNDQNWEGGIRQAVFHRLRHVMFRLHTFDGVFVPGESGETYQRALGFPKSRILPGLYGADPEIFNAGPPLKTRPKQFTFVGQLINRKNILMLVETFLSLASEFPEWSLNIVGEGLLADHIPHHPQISMKGFMQPSELACHLRSSRCLVLPSHEEHWGLVVHEAASCGCALVLSNAIGSAVDLATTENARLFESNDKSALAHALRRIAAWSDEDWTCAEKTSLSLSRKFGPHVFAKSAQTLVEGLL